MAKRRMGVIALLLCLFLWQIPLYAGAASTADAKEPIDTDRLCELTVGYGYDGTVFRNEKVMLYKIAEVSADFRYTLTPSLEETGLILNGVQTNGEWNVIRSTLEAYILANHIAPVAETTTNELGQAVFSQLMPGMYLVSGVKVPWNDSICAFGGALVALPGLETDGLWQYSVSVAAKPQILPPGKPDEEIKQKVLKLWKGDEGVGNRPQNIEVEIFRDGVSWKTVMLSEENQWTYGWIVPNDGASWHVVERNVPAGYTMTVEQREATFVVTNTRISENPEIPTPPQTGDTVHILLFTVLMYVSGAMLILLGLAGKRKCHEETNETQH